MILFSGRIRSARPARCRSSADGEICFRIKVPSVVSALILLFFMSVLSGCNTNAIYSDDLYNPPVYWGTHVVKSGETLYGIAWRYGRDYRELGDANGIRPPWNLRAGQVLRLDRKGTIRHAAKSSPPPRMPAATAPTSAGKAASRPPSRTPSSTPSRNTGSQMVANINWRWPHAGTVIAKYSTSGKVNKGIDIVGNPGDAVKAAADGNVVYAGNGLLGYGNLIIVNHNENYLSAYAHNRKILVQEGEDVKAGQVIAELGSSGTDRPMLHFEIRKNGNPVDPSRYLPRR